MLETILTLSGIKNHPFYEKIDFLKNHNPYFAQVSTPAWGYHVVTIFRCTPKRVVDYFVHKARKLYCAMLFGTSRKLNFEKGPKPEFRATFGRLPIEYETQLPPPLDSLPPPPPPIPSPVGKHWPF